MIRPAVCADHFGIYALVYELEETSVPQEIFAWGLNTMLADASHLLLVAEVQGKIVGLLHLRMEFQLHHCGNHGTHCQQRCALPRNRCRLAACSKRAGDTAQLHSV